MRMKIQQVSFNGKRIGAKRRPVSDISDRIETLVLIDRCRFAYE